MKKLTAKKEDKIRCGWVNLKNKLYIKYHDEEWSAPLYDDQKLFELLCLEGAQAGLSWESILNKREEYRKCFWGFDTEEIIKKSDEELLERIQSFGVIKNKLKTLSIKKNALAYEKIKKEHGSLNKFLWSCVQNKQIINVWNNYKDAPVSTSISEKLGKDLKKYGFAFVGPVICYAFMQASGMVSDHEKGCFKSNNIYR